MKKPNVKGKTSLKPITESDLKELLNKALKDPKFSNILKKDFDKALALEGFVISRKIQQELKSKALQQISLASKEKPADTNKPIIVNKGGKGKRIDVSINSKTGQRKIIIN